MGKRVRVPEVRIVGFWWVVMDEWTLWICEGWCADTAPGPPGRSGARMVVARRGWLLGPGWGLVGPDRLWHKDGRHGASLCSECMQKYREMEL